MIYKRLEDTSTAYCGKQVEYLMLFEDVYASRPLATRFLVTGDKLVMFLYERVCCDKKLKFLKLI